MDHRPEPDIREGVFRGMVEAPRYHAQIKGEPGFWAAGDSQSEAIGDLIQSHPERFGVVVTHLEGKHGR